MKIGILGAGNVGVALANAWKDAGHQVVIGVRDLGKSRPGSAIKPGIERVSLEAAAEADVVVLATPWTGTLDLVRGQGLRGRTVIDATNPVNVSAAGVEKLATRQSSGAEDVAAEATGAFVFKTLNQAGSNVLGAARQASVPSLMFVAGDDAARKKIVLGLVSDLGFDARDAGSLKAAAYLEGMAILWIEQAMRGPVGRNFAFAAVPWGQAPSR